MHITGPPPKNVKLKYKKRNKEIEEEHDIDEELVLDEPENSTNEKSAEQDTEEAVDVNDDGDQDGDQIEDDNDQNATEKNEEENVQDVPDLDDANEDDLEDY